MNTDVGFFNFSLNKILTENQTTLNQARIRLLYYGLCLAIIVVSVFLYELIINNQVILSVSTSILLFSIIILFKYLTFRPRWTIISHILLVMGTMINFCSIYFIFQNINIITVQNTILLILISFYMLGRIGGLLYSLVNLLPILVFIMIGYNNSYFIPIKPRVIDAATLVSCVFVNFALIIFVLNHFYAAFIKSIDQHKQIADEHVVLNTQLEKAIEKAEKSSHAKSEFLSTMSHEIRTPLNAVIGMSNLMMMGNPRPDQRENLDILKFSANNLLAIVNDVLDFNKIESGKIVFENIRFNPVELMRNICGGQTLKAEEKGLEFQCDIDDALKNKIIWGDPTRLTQIIFNLVSNAIKFTHEGKVWVKMVCVEDHHNTITIGVSVMDTGIGIEKENLGIIFEPFTQESITTTRQYGGTGLGLAIVKRLLELQGLQMSVVSEAGAGSTFSFRMEFPVSTDTVVEQAATQLPGAGNDSLGSMRVLLAEDNMVNIMLMKKLFSRWNIIPSVAENGEQAVDMVQHGNFDIILMDLQMPVLNGFDAAVEIRKMSDQKKASTPIIALTASALFDIKERVFNSGMNDYVSKPFKPGELLEKMQNLVETHC